MDKIILVHYVPMGEKFREIARSISDNLKRYDDIISYIIPTEKTFKVECINPSLVTSEEYLTEVKNILQKAHDHAQKYLDNEYLGA